MEVETLTDKNQREQELNLVLNRFFKMLYVDFGLRATQKMREWYTMSWEEFKEELARNKVRITECSIQDWEKYFYQEKAKANELLQNT